MVLVSIGIPTYNRARLLARCLESARGQTHTELEIVICDNASEDETEQLCRAAAAGDPRIRYLRHLCNLGPTANFNALFGACRGAYVLMLADDDFLEPEYVARCLTVLQAEPGTALVAGRARYERAGTPVADGALHVHPQADPGARVVSYLRTVEDNGVFYGLVPHEVLRRAVPLPNVLGNDWLHVARIAAQGPIRTLADVHIVREVGGTSVDVHSILDTFGAAGWQRRIPQLVIAWWILRDVGWAHPAYRGLGRAGRLRVALAGAAASIRWPDLAWHIVTPSVARLARRPRGRSLWTAYLWLARRLGAAGS